MTITEIADVYLHPTEERSGWQTFFATDKHGCLLHTEPVCSVYVGDGGHRWFAEWLYRRKMPVQMIDLLEHMNTDDLPDRSDST